MPPAECVHFLRRRAIAIGNADSYATAACLLGDAMLFSPNFKMPPDIYRSGGTIKHVLLALNVSVKNGNWRRQTAQDHLRSSTE